MPRAITLGAFLIFRNGGSVKLDIREWSPEHDKMSKEITLTYKFYSKSEPLSYYSESNLMFRGDR